MAGRAILIVLACLVSCAGGFAQDLPAVTAPALPRKTQVPKGRVSGTVYCVDTNQPARLAHVMLVPTGKDQTGRDFRADSDLEGRFSFNNVPEGKYYVSAHLLGYINLLDAWVAGGRLLSDEKRKSLESQLTTVFVGAHQTASVALRLERGAEISGTVLFDDGSPAIGVDVRLRPKDGIRNKGNDLTSYVEAWVEEAERVTDDHGRFRILGVAPGEYTVGAELPAASAEHDQNAFATSMQASPMGGLGVYFGDTLRASRAKTIKVAGGEVRADADISIPLSKLHTIRGHVVVKSTGQTPPTAVVQLLYSDTREVTRVSIAASGEFEFSYIADDSYILQAFSSSEVPPKLDIDDESDSMVMGGSWGFTMQPGEKGPTEKAGELAVLVQGDMSGLMIETPDPPATPKSGAALQTTVAPEESERPEPPQ